MNNKLVTGYVIVYGMDIYNQIGTMAIGSRLRRLSSSLTEDAQKLYELYGVGLKSKWFPVFYFLSTQTEPQPISVIARYIGQSHPSVIKIVREMAKEGLIIEKEDPSDKRKTNIGLSKKGRLINEDVQDQYTDVTQTIGQMLAQTQHNLWLAIEEFEYLLSEKSLVERVIAQRKKRESDTVEVVAYTDAHQQAFKELNEAWIRHYFRLEEADKVALDNPQSYILDKGGKILVALYGGEVVGVCALMKIADKPFDFELAKMAVSERARGKGIGYKLGKAIVDLAKSLGASSLFLESNTRLEPALTLYRKLGFKKVTGYPSPYERSNIQMVLYMDSNIQTRIK